MPDITKKYKSAPSILILGGGEIYSWIQVSPVYVISIAESFVPNKLSMNLHVQI